MDSRTLSSLLDGWRLDLIDGQENTIKPAEAIHSIEMDIIEQVEIVYNPKKIDPVPFLIDIFGTILEYKNKKVKALDTVDALLEIVEAAEEQLK